MVLAMFGTSIAVLIAMLLLAVIYMYWYCETFNITLD